jgi:hypothetical protein
VPAYEEGGSQGPTLTVIAKHERTPLLLVAMAAKVCGPAGAPAVFQLNAKVGPILRGDSGAQSTYNCILTIVDPESVAVADTGTTPETAPPSRG